MNIWFIPSTRGRYLAWTSVSKRTWLWLAPQTRQSKFGHTAQAWVSNCRLISSSRKMLWVWPSIQLDSRLWLAFTTECEWWMCLLTRFNNTRICQSNHVTKSSSQTAVISLPACLSTSSMYTISTLPRTLLTWPLRPMEVRLDQLLGWQMTQDLSRQLLTPQSTCGPSIPKKASRTQSGALPCPMSISPVLKCSSQMATKAHHQYLPQVRTSQSTRSKMGKKFADLNKASTSTRLRWCTMAELSSQESMSQISQVAFKWWCTPSRKEKSLKYKPMPKWSTEWEYLMTTLSCILRAPMAL